MKFLLVMRRSYGSHGDHIQSLRQLGAELHLVTEVHNATSDGRFASATVLDNGAIEDALATAAEVGKQCGVDAAITFQETDIVFTARLNKLLGTAGVSPEAAATGRDKSHQRRFLDAHGIPSVRFSEVATLEDGLDKSEAFGFPLVIKPTRAAASKNVALVRNRAELEAELRRICQLAEGHAGNYYEEAVASVALLEEFLPGEEVTLDGVVLFGKLYLGGIHNKHRSPGPYFEEDFYTLPFRTAELEPELLEVASAITSGLELKHSLFNVELRQDALGQFRVVEFSPRISGGHAYRNLRDVYGLDLVRLFAKSFRARSAFDVFAGEVPRLPARMATCIKFVYKTGLVRRNGPGEAFHSPHYVAYYPLALPGTRVARSPVGFDITGLLSVATAYRRPTDVDQAEVIAARVESELDVIVDSENSATRWSAGTGVLNLVAGGARRG